jgi:hypothetical protein
MLKKRIINEVKMIIAGKKVLKGLRTNVHVKEALIDRYFQLIVLAEKVLEKFLLRSYYRLMFKKRIFMATLYLETKDPLRKSQKVQLIGSFTSPPWTKRITCTWDNIFKCFKADKVKIKIG